MHYVFLTLAIVSEVIATSALKAANGFKSLGPSCLVFVGYTAAFYFLSLTLRTLPVGIAYAIWRSGVRPFEDCPVQSLPSVYRGDNARTSH